MSGNNKRVPRKKPDHESGFYEEYPAEDECSSSNNLNVNSRTSEDYPNKMKKTSKKSDITPPNGFPKPQEKIPINDPVTPPSNKNSQRNKPNAIDESDNYVLILSDGEEEEAATTSNGSNTKENLKMDCPESDKPKPIEDRNQSCTVTGSYSQTDFELEQISKIRKYGGRSSSYLYKYTYEIFFFIIFISDLI